MNVIVLNPVLDVAFSRSSLFRQTSTEVVNKLIGRIAVFMGKITLFIYFLWPFKLFLVTL